MKDIVSPVPMNTKTSVLVLSVSVIVGLAIIDVNTQVVTQSLEASIGQLSRFCFNENFVPKYTDSGDSGGSRIQSSLFGFVIGIFLLIFSVLFSFAVERFAVKFSFVIGRALRACVPNVTSERINKNLNCRMIHISGQMSVEVSASDDEVSYTPNRSAVVLKRRVEILQWHEHKEKHEETRDGSKHVTYTYSYTLGWTENDVDSSGFHEQNGHFNPPRVIPLKSKTFYAEAHVGAYRMSAEQTQKLKRFHVSELSPEAAASVSTTLLKLPEGYKYVGLRDGSCLTRVEGQATARGEAYWSSLYDEYSNLPRKFLYIARAVGDGCAATPGDVRICYDAVHEGPVSLAGVLQYDSFRAFNERDAHTASGRLAELLLPSGGSCEDERGAASGGCCRGCCGGFCDAAWGAVWQIIYLCMATDARTSILPVEERAVGAAGLFRDEDTKFHTRLALLRGGAALLLWLSLGLVLGPVSTLLSFLPLVGGLLQGLFAIAAFILAALLWLTVAAVAWFSSHPYGLAALLLVEVTPGAEARPAPPALSLCPLHTHTHKSTHVHTQESRYPCAALAAMPPRPPLAPARTEPAGRGAGGFALREGGPGGRCAAGDMGAAGGAGGWRRRVGPAAARGAVRA